MYSSTKNAQDEQTLIKMAKKAFPDCDCAEINELTDGYFNVAYFVKLSDGKESILKIAPPKEAKIMSYERNIMDSEVAAMRLVSEVTDVPVAKIFYYDDSCTVCSSSYFFMEKLKGNSIYLLNDQISKEQKRYLHTLVGQLNRRINAITGDKFGYPGVPEMQGENWYNVFRQMLHMLIKDAEAMTVDLKVPVTELWQYLERDQSVFESVKVPQLVHWDLWEGNIFVDDGKVTGLIDWERWLWADPLMEVGFRTYHHNMEFLEGYGITELSAQEYRRALWYDIYYMLLAAQECAYRQYDTMSMYEWSTGVLIEKFTELRNSQIIY